MERLQLGKVSLTIIHEGTFRMDGGAMFGLVPRPLWAKVMPPDEHNRVPCALRGLLVQTEGANILVDTGMGDKLSDREKEIYGMSYEPGFLQSLGQAGLRPKDIHTVINSHLHMDHTGNNTIRQDGRLVPAFPKAEYLVQRQEWLDATHTNDRTRGAFHPDDYLPLEEHRVLRLLDGDTQVTPEVYCLLSYGHTYGHQSVLIRSGGAAALYLGDVAPYGVNIERLAWITGLDWDPVRNLETKRRLVAQTEQEGHFIIISHHLPFAIGKLERRDGVLRVVPAV